MPELLKDKYYNTHTLHEMAMSIRGVYPAFQVEDFVADIMDETCKALELKARVRKVTIHLGQ